MRFTHNSVHGSERFAQEMSTQERQLIAEISFWREQIDHPDRQLSERSLERMRQALALAERKLQSLASERASPVVGWAKRLKPTGQENT